MHAGGHACMADEPPSAAQALVMQVPFVGPLAYVPMQFAAAWLLDLLLRRQPVEDEIAAPSLVSVSSAHWHNA